MPIEDFSWKVEAAIWTAATLRLLDKSQARCHLVRQACDTYEWQLFSNENIS